MVQSDSASQIASNKYNVDLKELLSMLPNEVEMLSSARLEEVCRYSYVKRFLVKECTKYNEFIIRVRRSLTDARLTDQQIYTGDMRLSKIAAQLKKCIVPEEWTKSWPRKAKKGFKIWAYFLMDRYAYFARFMVRIDLNYTRFDLSMLSDCRGLLNAYFLDCTYTRAPNMKFDDIVMVFKLTNVMDLNSDQLNDSEGIHLSGMRVVNGNLDRNRGEITDHKDNNSGEACSVITVVCKYYKKIQDKSDPRSYLCSVMDGIGENRQDIDEIEPVFKLVDYIVTLESDLQRQTVESHR